jgi:hypothetical protein
MRECRGAPRVRVMWRARRRASSSMPLLAWKLTFNSLANTGAVAMSPTLPCPQKPAPHTHTLSLFLTHTHTLSLSLHSRRHSCTLAVYSLCLCPPAQIFLADGNQVPWQDRNAQPRRKRCHNTAAVECVGAHAQETGIRCTSPPNFKISFVGTFALPRCMCAA